MALSERIINFMLVFAIFGAVSGAITGTMEATDTNWFTGASAVQVEDYQILSSDEIERMNSTGGVIGENGAFFSNAIGATDTIIHAAYRVLYIKDLVEQYFYIPAPTNPEVNLFSPWALIIQVVLWLCYGVFICEVLLKFKFS